MPFGGLFEFLIMILVVGLIFWLLWWAVGKLPAPFNPPAQVVVVVIFVVVLLWMLYQVIGGTGLGHPFYPR